jgi:hypothetical protein
MGVSTYYLKRALDILPPFPKGASGKPAGRAPPLDIGDADG